MNRAFNDKNNCNCPSFVLVKQFHMTHVAWRLVTPGPLYRQRGTHEPSNTSWRPVVSLLCVSSSVISVIGVITNRCLLGSSCQCHARLNDLIFQLNHLIIIVTELRVTGYRLLIDKRLNFIFQGHAPQGDNFDWSVSGCKIPCLSLHV